MQATPATSLPRYCSIIIITAPAPLLLAFLTLCPCTYAADGATNHADVLNTGDSLMQFPLPISYTFTSLTKQPDYPAMSHSEFGRGATGIHTVEGNQAGARAAKLTQKREQDQKEYEAKKVRLVPVRVVMYGIDLPPSCLPSLPPSLPFLTLTLLPFNTNSARSKTTPSGPWVESTRNLAASNRPLLA